MQLMTVHFMSQIVHHDFVDFIILVTLFCCLLLSFNEILNISILCVLDFRADVERQE